MADKRYYRKKARQYARRQGINPTLFERQISAESGFNPNAGSPAGARGIAQFMPATARSRGVNPSDPKSSLRGAAKLMREYLDSYGGDWRKALTAYNAGPGRVGKPLYGETRNYIQKIVGGGSGRQSKPGAKKVRRSTTTKRIPGVDRSEERRQLLANYVLNQRPMNINVRDPLKMIDQGGDDLLSTVQQLRQIKDTPSRTIKVKGKQKTRVRRSGRSGGVHLKDGGGWGGTARLAKSAKKVAAKQGIRASSEKRARRNTASGGVSDHWVGNKNAYAVDLPSSGAALHRLGRSIAHRYGVRYVPNSYASGGTVNVNGRKYRIQILGGAGVDHGDHIHVGIKRL